MAEIGYSSFVTMGMEVQYKVEYIALWDTVLLCSQYTVIVLSILFGHRVFCAYRKFTRYAQFVQSRNSRNDIVVNYYGHRPNQFFLSI